MGDGKKQVRERAAKVAAMRAEQMRKERRQKFLLFGAVTVVCLGLIAAVAVALAGEARRQAEVEAAANAPIEGVQEYEDLSAGHVTDPVDYGTSPPVGGDHSTVWQNCDVYTEPVPNENAVHSLEHGAVWITYSPDLSADQVTALTEKATRGQGYTLVSPYENLESAIVLSAWGVQLSVDDAADPRIDAFLAKHVQGEQTPEPGASCSGGTTDTSPA